MVVMTGASRREEFYAGKDLMLPKSCAVKTPTVFALRNHDGRLFFACVGEVVFDVPGLAAVGGTAAELADLIRAAGDELQVALEGWAGGLGNFVGEVIHHALFESAVKENVAADVVDPILFPTLLRLVVNVVAFAGVPAVLTFPVFLHHAIFENQFDFTVAGGDAALRGGHAPFAQPEIKLTVLGCVGAGALIFPGLFDELGKAGVAMERGQAGIGAQDLRLRVALLNRFFQVLEGFFRLLHGAVYRGFAVFAKER